MAETPFFSEAASPGGGGPGGEAGPAPDAAAQPSAGSAATAPAAAAEPSAQPEFPAAQAGAPQAAADEPLPPSAPAADAVALDAVALEPTAVAPGPAAIPAAVPPRPPQPPFMPPAEPADLSLSIAPPAPEPAATAEQPGAEAPPAAPPLEEPAGVAATIAVPPLEGEPGSGGGEWEMLLGRLEGWLGSGELSRRWQAIRGPLKGVAILLVLLLALRTYAAVVSTVDAIPVISGLLELVGLITVLQFTMTRLVRASDRREVFSSWHQRWLDFRGRD